MNALKRVARGERTTMIVIVLVAAVALVLGVGGFFMARTFLTSADSGTTASKANSDSNGGMSGDSSSSPSETSQAPDTAPQSEAAAPTPEATASSMPPCEDGTSAPDGTCLHPASVQWLDDLLPDPSTVDRKDADAVCSAYVITNQTWDASRDVTDAFASIRASVYETPRAAAYAHADPPSW